MTDLTPLFVAVLAFCAVTAIVFVVGQYYNTYTQMLRRLPVSAQASGASAVSSSTPLQAFIARHFHEQRFGVDSALRAKLRRDLLRAGFFRNDAINYYIFFRIILVVVLPAIAYVLMTYVFSDAPWPAKFAVVVISAGLGIIGPTAIFGGREIGPEISSIVSDLLDLLVVCIDAGLSLTPPSNGSGDHQQYRPLGVNLRSWARDAGRRSTVDASIVGRSPGPRRSPILHDAVAPIARARRRGRRVARLQRRMRTSGSLRAEEMANKLSVKMVIPLSLFIFPVVLLVIGFPIGVRLAVLFALGVVAGRGVWEAHA